MSKPPVPNGYTYATAPTACVMLNEYASFVPVTRVHAPPVPSWNATHTGTPSVPQNCHVVLPDDDCALTVTGSVSVWSVRPVAVPLILSDCAPVVAVPVAASVSVSVVPVVLAAA